MSSSGTLPLAITLRVDGSGQVTGEIGKVTGGLKTLEDRARASSDGIARGQGALQSALSGTRSTVSSLANEFSVLRAAAVVAGAAFVGRSFIGTASEFENIGIQIRFLTKSTKEAADATKLLRDYAAETPFSLEEISRSAPSLLAVSKGTEELARNLKITGDIAAATGLTFDVTAQQLQMAMSAGIASADTFRLRSVGSMLGFQAGVATSAEETKRKIYDMWFGPGSATNTLKGAAEAMKDTWTGITSMLGDKWVSFKADLMDGGPFEFLKASFAELNARADANFGGIKNVAHSTGAAIVEITKNIALGGASIIDTLGGPISAVAGALDGMWQGYKALPEEAQTLGIVGALLFGKKGIVAIGAAASAINNIGEITGLIREQAISSAVNQIDAKIAEARQAVAEASAAFENGYASAVNNQPGGASSDAATALVEDLRAAQQALADLAAQRDKLIAAPIPSTSILGTDAKATGEAQTAVTQFFDAVQKRIEDARAKAAAAGQDVAKAGAAAAGVSAEASKAAIKAETDYQSALKKTLSALDPLGSKQAELISQMALLDQAIGKQKGSTDQLVVARGKLAAQLDALRNPLTAITEAHTKNVVQLNAELAAIKAGEAPYKQYLASKKVEEESQRIINDLLAKGYDIRNINTQAITDQVREEQGLVAQIDAEKEARTGANDAWEAFVTEVLGAFVNATGSMGDAFSSLLGRMKQEVINAGIGSLFGFKTSSTPLLSGIGQLLGIGGAAVGASGAQAAGGGGVSPSTLASLFKGGSLFPGIQSSVFSQLGQLSMQPGLLGDIGLFGSNAAGSMAKLPGGFVGGGLISAGAGFLGGQLGASVFGGEAGLGSAAGGIGGALLGAQFGALGGPLGAFAGAFIGSALDKVIGGDGPETRAAVFAGADTSRAEVKHTVASVTGASGLALAGEAQRVGAEGEKAVAGMVDTFSKIDATLTQLSRAAGLSVDLSGVKNFGSGQFSASDMVGAGRDFVRAWITAVSEPFDSELQAAARGLVGNTAEDLINAYQSLLTIRDSIANGGIFAGLGSLQQISQAVAPAEIQRIAAFGAQLKGLQATMATDGVQAWEQSQRSVFELWRDQGDAIVSAAEVAASSEDFSVLTAAVQERYATEQQLIGQIMGALQTAADQFGQSYESIFVDGLKTEEERYNYFRAQADAIAQTMTTLTDPSAISAAATNYNQTMMQAYSSLSAESRDAMRADILSTVDAVGDLATERLNSALGAVNADNNANVPGSVANAVEAAVTAAVADLQQAVTDAIAALAAQQQSTASADADNTAAFGGWVQKLPGSINVNVAVPRGAEVAFA